MPPRYLEGISERCLAESNRCSRFCRPVPNRSAKAPFSVWDCKYRDLKRICKIYLAFFPKRNEIDTSIRSCHNSKREKHYGFFLLSGISLEKQHSERPKGNNKSFLPFAARALHHQSSLHLGRFDSR